MTMLSYAADLRRLAIFATVARVQPVTFFREALPVISPRRRAPVSELEVETILICTDKV
jgi:hypothetical protein